MIGWIIAAVLLLLIFAVPYGIDASYTDGIFRLAVKAGVLRFFLLPAKPKTPQQLARAAEKKRLKKEKKAAEKAEKEAKAAAKPPKAKKPPDMDFLLALAGMGIRAVKRFFKSLSLDRLDFRYTAASDDPFDTAAQYSAACAAASALAPLNDRVIRARCGEIVLDADFDRDKPDVSGRIVVSLQLYKIVLLGIAFAFEYLKWKVQHRKSAAASERTDEHGREQNQRDHGRNDDEDQAAC